MGCNVKGDKGVGWGGVSCLILSCLSMQGTCLEEATKIPLSLSQLGYLWILQDRVGRQRLGRWVGPWGTQRNGLLQRDRERGSAREGREEEKEKEWRRSLNIGTGDMLVVNSDDAMRGLGGGHHAPCTNWGKKEKAGRKRRATQI